MCVPTYMRWEIGDVCTYMWWEVGDVCTYMWWEVGDVCTYRWWKVGDVCNQNTVCVVVIHVCMYGVLGQVHFDSCLQYHSSFLCQYILFPMSVNHTSFLCLLHTQFCNDMFLMFDNAWLYNKKTSKVYKMCTKLYEVFSEHVDSTMKSFGYCCGCKVS